MADLTIKQYVDFTVRFSGIAIDGVEIDTADFSTFKCKLRDRQVQGASQQTTFIPGGTITLTTATVGTDSTAVDASLTDVQTGTLGLTFSTSREQLPIVDLHLTRTSDSLVFATDTKTVAIVEGPAHD